MYVSTSVEHYMGLNLLLVNERLIRPFMKSMPYQFDISFSVIRKLNMDRYYLFRTDKFVYANNNIPGCEVMPAATSRSTTID